MTVTDFEQDLKVDLYESFKNEQHYSDGVIFRNIRKYAKQNNTEVERKWWARLTSSKARDLGQLLKVDMLRVGFDRLVDFSGLWPPIQLGTLHRLHCLRCPEVWTCHLDISGP